MADGFSFDDDGQIAQLAADLGSASLRTTAQASAVVRKSGSEVEAYGKNAAPVDTGALKNSISASYTALSAEVGPTVNYGVFVEAGTSRMPPQPYMSPALERATPGFVTAMEEIGGRIFE